MSIDVSSLDYLTALYGRCDRGQIVFVESCRNRKSAVFNVDQLELAARHIEREPTELFIKVNPIDHQKLVVRSPHGIGGTNEVVAVVGFHLDVDAGKNDKYLTREMMLEAIAKMPLEPSAIIETNGDGGGFHAYWWLQEPFYIDTEEQRGDCQSISNRWLHELREFAKPGTIDGTADLCRVLRPIGSLRRKTGNRVRALHWNPNQRYTLEQFRLPEVAKAEQTFERRHDGESIIERYLDAIGENHPGILLERYAGYTHQRDGFYIRPGSESGSPTGEVYQRPDGSLGFTFKSGACDPFTSTNKNGTNGNWYSSAAIYVMLCHGDDWKAAAIHCHKFFRGTEGNEGHEYIERVAQELLEKAEPQENAASSDSAPPPDSKPEPKSSVAERKEYWERRGYYQPIGLGEFLERDYRVEFLIDRCLVANQSCIIAGASKSLKTTTSLHLALSLASGKPFLNQFSATQTPMMFASAESGEGILQRNLKGMASMMDISDADLAILIGDRMFSIQFWVPRINDNDLMDYFSDCIDMTGAKAVVLDPLYMAMEGDSQHSLGLNGEQIQKLCRLITDKGATPIVDDHVKRSSANAKEYKPIVLEDITGAGKAESFRQWMLLGRRSAYQDDDSHSKVHDLWLTIGGSAGHSGTWGLDVSESFDPCYTSVQYAFTATRGSAVRDAQKAAIVDAAANRKAKKEAEKEATFQRRLESVERAMTAKKNEAFTKSDVKSLLRCNSDQAGEVLFRLEADNKIAKHPEKVKRGNNKCEAWHLQGELVLTHEINAGHAGLDARNSSSPSSPTLPPTE
jgi:hypothetical protein